LSICREKKQQLKAEDKSHANVDKKKKQQQEDTQSKQAIKQQSNDSSDQIDFNNIPLPDLPTKQKSKHLNKGKSLSKDSVLPTSTAAKIQSKWKQLTEKEYFKKMHYRNSSFEKKPTYLFGENAGNVKQQQHKDGIFLNRSGWITTSSQRLQQEAESRKENISKLKKANSKIEELISRSEARRSNQHKDENVTIVKIDSQSERQQQILNDRPAYLPVKTNLARDGPPPTPILSPPPAFQDHQIRNRIFEMKNGTRIQLSVTDDSDNNKTPTSNVGKGMVFSRSFEYDNRKTSEFNENFSRSFDFDFQLGERGYNKNFLSRFDNVGAFSNYTGKSPNYLTKKENGPIPASSAATAASIFPKVIPGNKVKMGNPNYYNSLDDALASRRPKYGQTSAGMSNYRSLETSSSINKRLNSCDSGARSGTNYGK
jgi:hypothetical protein